MRAVDLRLVRACEDGAQELDLGRLDPSVVHEVHHELVAAEQDGVGHAGARLVRVVLVVLGQALHEVDVRSTPAVEGAQVGDVLVGGQVGDDHGLVVVDRMTVLHALQKMLPNESRRPWSGNWLSRATIETFD